MINFDFLELNKLFTLNIVLITNNLKKNSKDSLSKILIITLLVLNNYQTKHSWGQILNNI